jgi:prolyl 4-hydroxylase
VAGDADALFAQAAAKLAGEGTPRDLPAARDLFRQAGEAGRRDAAVIHANLVANGTGGASDWTEGMRLLRRLAPANPRSARELAIIEAMDLTRAGDPVATPPGTILSERPHVVRFDGLFTVEECRYLAAAAAPMLQPSVVVDNRTGRQIRDPVRTSDGVGFTWPLENPAVHALNRRIAAASGTRVEQGEPLQVLRYRPGQEYKTHYDAIPGFANQRVMTMLVWLNDAYRGGETSFPSAGLEIRGRIGDAILFRNTGPDGRRDEAAAHAGCPVTRGEKIIASRWIRAEPFELPVGGQAA